VTAPWLAASPYRPGHYVKADRRNTVPTITQTSIVIHVMMCACFMEGLNCHRNHLGPHLPSGMLWYQPCIHLAVRCLSNKADSARKYRNATTKTDVALMSIIQHQPNPLADSMASAPKMMWQRRRSWSRQSDAAG